MPSHSNLIAGVKLHVLAYKTPPPVDLTNPDDEISYSFTTVEKLEWGFFLMQILSMGFTKLSFIFFYRRIFVTGKPRSIFGVISLTVAVIIILWTLAFFLWFLLSCGNKFETRWTTVNTLHHNCPSDIKSDLALAISDFLTDVIIITLPIPMVLRLQMTTGRKLAVLAVFGLGSVAMIASIIRLALFVNITEIASGKISDPSADNDLLSTRGLYWSMLESGLALTACCLPTLNAFVRLPALRSVISSVISLASIRSTQPGSQKLSQGVDQSHFNTEEGSMASRTAFVLNGTESNNVETYAMGGLAKTLREGNGEAKDEILVERTIEQRNDIV